MPEGSSVLYANEEGGVLVKISDGLKEMGIDERPCVQPHHCFVVKGAES